LSCFRILSVNLGSLKVVQEHSAAHRQSRNITRRWKTKATPTALGRRLAKLRLPGTVMAFGTLALTLA